ncbi:MAG: hypothetical protein PHT91_00705 [Candidatus Nanoarchaeia archaeon]|nr:hypothetical protein [Candidatus Nanoarchaeia archaeon]MDD5053781.1 hypothetical protein [Candidatus Nanoarchaeia archaeon]MDD5499379.1 hypothetical protein [Candidatus Nanoarchaeia archaeon]
MGGFIEKLMDNAEDIGKLLNGRDWDSIRDNEKRMIWGIFLEVDYESAVSILERYEIYKCKIKRYEDYKKRN